MKKTILDLQKFAKPNTLPKIEKLIFPEDVYDYTVQRATELNKLIKSGIAVTSDEVKELANGKGIVAHLPFLQPLTGESVATDETTVLVPEEANSDEQVAIRFIRSKAWKANDVARMVAGVDPLKAFLGQLEQYWDTETQKAMISIIKGLFAPSGALNTTHLFDTSGVLNHEAISGEAILDAKQKLGDHATLLNNIAMHSATYTTLQKQQLIEYRPTGEANVSLPYFMDYKVMVDDAMPESEGVYTTVLFGDGAFAYAVGAPAEDEMPTLEFDRNSLASTNIMITRRCIVLHPQGMKWAGEVKTSVSNVDFETAANWKKAFSDKNIVMVALKHKLANTGAGA